MSGSSAPESTTFRVWVSSAITTIGRRGTSLVGPETSDVSAVKVNSRSSKWGREGLRIDARLRRRGLAGVGEVGVVPGELAVVEPRGERDLVRRVLGHVEAEVHGVGGARRDQPHVDDRPGLVGVALVDLVAVLVDHQRLVEVGALVDRGVLVRHAAPVDRLAGGVDRLELEPAVVGVDGAAGEEVADAAGADHHVDAGRLAAPDGRRDAVERRVDRSRPGRWARRRCRPPSLTPRRRRRWSREPVPRWRGRRSPRPPRGPRSWRRCRPSPGGPGGSR